MLLLLYCFCYVLAMVHCAWAVCHISSICFLSIRRLYWQTNFVRNGKCDVYVVYTCIFLLKYSTPSGKYNLKRGTRCWTLSSGYNMWNSGMAQNGFRSMTWIYKQYYVTTKRMDTMQAVQMFSMYYILMLIPWFLSLLYFHCLNQALTCSNQ